MICCKSSLTTTQWLESVTIQNLTSKKSVSGQVLPDGRFVALADLGRHLAPDDALVVGEAAVAEQRWRAVHPKVHICITKSNMVSCKCRIKCSLLDHSEQQVLHIECAA